MTIRDPATCEHDLVHEEPFEVLTDADGKIVGVVFICRLCGKELRFDLQR